MTGVILALLLGTGVMPAHAQSDGLPLYDQCPSCEARKEERERERDRKEREKDRREREKDRKEREKDRKEREKDRRERRKDVSP